MIPIHLAGIALAGKMLQPKLKEYTLSRQSKKPIELQQKKVYKVRDKASLVNPLQTLFKGLSSSISKISQKPVREDYNAIVESFIPGNAILLKPQFPVNSTEIQFTDLDGGLQNGIITSFRHDGQLKTLILKKQDGNWNKAAEILNSDHSTLHYRGFADIAGEGKKQLIIGLKSEDKTPTLYGYSIENNNIKEMFSRNYHRFELLQAPPVKNRPSKAHLAIWNSKGADAYDIEMLDWNGSQLEPLKNITHYYRQNIIPYYAQKVKRAPYDAAHWYNLADTLVKSGAYGDALIAIQVGMNQSSDPALKESLLALKSKVTGS